MLVLTRRKDEAVIIDGDIRVSVVEIRGDRVKLGFEAPREREIHREEIWFEINNAGGEAAGESSDVDSDLHAAEVRSGSAVAGRRRD